MAKFDTVPKSRTKIVDGRSATAVLIRRTKADLIAHVGGSPTATQRCLIERAATLTAYCRRLDAKALSPEGFTDHGRREYLAASNALRLALRALGLEAAPTTRPMTAAEGWARIQEQTSAT